jgi:hypothetical protein
MAYDAHPTYEAIKCETSRKPLIREKPAEFLGTGHECKDGLLPSVKHNIYESVEMFHLGFVRANLKYCILALSMLFLLWRCDSMIYIISAIIYIFNDGKIHLLMCVNTYSLN